MASQLASKSAISLKGSTDIVSEFFMYGINSILYQRGIYPPETFTRVQKYGLTLLVSTDPELKKYLNTVLAQVKDWLQNLTIKKMVAVIKCSQTSEVLERWQFDIQCDKTAANETAPRERSLQEIESQIKAIIRQITASVTFLPLLETSCVFDLLVYTDTGLEIPANWGESGPALISNSEEVRLRSFTTSIHAVDSMVAYKAE
ncbi:hypothetical protein CAPTEDRAFT_166738 [Capitella teleta]|uniref:Mitotic spindle assembly checkpoint protein MAD2A n=1 Tax=Capitella teleta TaxID=283909 RepID=R7URK4_CAPTE|nr:hypothetical protein CAPTEDRAFT_166738 [Capitella teleta]|eukprot:ELU06537.1 hypothetical protein CAPTEDRAFT_166738 [Capitella teleta]